MWTGEMELVTLQYKLLLALLCFSAVLGAVVDKNESFSWDLVREQGGELDPSREINSYRASGEMFTSDDLSSSLKNPLPLSPIGGYLKKKTILLIDGEASDTVSFRLDLREGERLMNVLHLVNDSMVITMQMKSVQEISAGPKAAYNISLTHEFEGAVGVASYLIHVTTTFGRYMQSGTFFVAGIVAKKPGSLQETVSGIGSPGLSFSDPNSVSLGAGIGQIALKLDYQGLGPDITEDPMPLEKVLSTAQFSVKQSESEAELPLLNFHATECTKVQVVEKDKDGAFVFPDIGCSIGYDPTAALLVLRLNRGRSGNIVVDIVLPAIMAGGEVFETSISIFVGEATTPQPVVVVEKELNLILDHYGNEVFTLLMYNTIKPVQKMNAKEYFVDLPGRRYAEIDFKRSTLVNPTQIVVFRTIPPGKGDTNVWDRIQRAVEASKSRTGKAMEPEETMGIETTPPPEMADGGIVELTRYLDTDTEFNATGMYELTSMSGNLPSDISQPVLALNMRPVIEEAHESQVYVLVPPEDNLIIAANNYNNPIRTTFAPKTLASKESVGNDALKETIEISILLKKFDTKTFSSFKSEQIKSSIKTRALALEKGTKGEARLVNLKDSPDGLLVTYELQVSGNSSKIADALSKDTGLADEIAKDTRLASGEVAAVSVRRAKSTGGTSSSVEESEDAVTGTVSAALIIAIVALVLILAIPLCVLVFGFITLRRFSRENDHSDTDAAAIAPNEEVHSPPSEPIPATPASHIARDTFGRTQEGQESYKMERELFKEGYYGDNPAPVQQKQ